MPHAASTLVQATVRQNKILFIWWVSARQGQLGRSTITWGNNEFLGPLVADVPVRQVSKGNH